MDFAVIDASFISLRQSLAPLIPLFGKTIKILALVKPQFELPRNKIAAGGIVREKHLHDEAMNRENVIMKYRTLTMFMRVWILPTMLLSFICISTGSAAADEFVSVVKDGVNLRSGPDTDLFRRGMKDFKGKNYKTAYKFFEKGLSSQPGEKQAAKTLYLMGECLFNLGEHDLAILDYQKVISNYSRNPHSSAALLRQGMSFEQLTDHETAKIIYTKLTSEYPDSREAKVARERMENL